MAILKPVLLIRLFIYYLSSRLITLINLILFLAQIENTNLSWFVSNNAFVFYLVFILLFVIGFVFWQIRTVKKLKSKLDITKADTHHSAQNLSRKEAIDYEEEWVPNELEGLKAQLKSKTIELATIAKENEERGEVLNIIKEHMQDLLKHPASLNRKVREVLSLLDTHLSANNKTFEIQIDELHQELFKTLREKHADLTTNDLRLCAYVKIGFNSKELANLLNIKPSSVYISRSRLRKKLDLDTDIDLYTYLNSL